MVIVLRPQICDVTSPYLLDECLDCGKRRGNFWGKGHVHACPKTICFELDEPIEMPFGLGCVGSGSIKDGVHIATTW